MKRLRKLIQAWRGSWRGKIGVVDKLGHFDRFFGGKAADQEIISGQKKCAGESSAGEKHNFLNHYTCKGSIKYLLVSRKQEDLC